MKQELEASKITDPDSEEPLVIKIILLILFYFFIYLVHI
jgi:hypothetical protein